jgi:hypothetical protein
MKTKNKVFPDFIMIPYQLLEDDRLTPVDRIVYGVIMWFSKMDDGKCTASNSSIGRMSQTASHTVANSLTRLELCGYLNRTYNGVHKKSRTEITPLVDNKNRLIKNDSLSSDKDTPLSLSKDTGYPYLGTYHSLSKDEGSGAILENISQSEAMKDENRVSLSEEEKKNRIQNLNTDYETTPSGMVSNGAILDDGEFTKMVKMNLRYDTPELVPEKEVSDAIALFLPVFPSQFVTGSPFAVMPNRTAVKKVLMRYDLARLKTLIDKYVEKKEDKFRPEANTIATFCGLKFDRIESYVSKSAGGLWAQQSISTPEQRATREEQYGKKINLSLQRTLKAKEEWDKNHKQV